MHNRVHAVHRLRPRWTACDLRQSPSVRAASLSSVVAGCQGAISVDGTLINAARLLGAKDATESRSDVSLSESSLAPQFSMASKIAHDRSLAPVNGAPLGGGKRSLLPVTWSWRSRAPTLGVRRSNWVGALVTLCVPGFDRCEDFREVWVSSSTLRRRAISHSRISDYSTCLTLIPAVLIASSPIGAAPTACPEHFANGSAPDIVRTTLAARVRELCFEGYAVLHSGIARTPLAVAEHLTRARMAGARGQARGGLPRGGAAPP
jgi:hypothetical protein